jgi:hypothetical protein
MQTFSMASLRINSQNSHHFSSEIRITILSYVGFSFSYFTEQLLVIQCADSEADPQHSFCLDGHQSRSIRRGFSVLALEAGKERFCGLRWGRMGGAAWCFGRTTAYGR